MIQTPQIILALGALKRAPYNAIMLDYRNFAIHHRRRRLVCNTRQNHVRFYLIATMLVAYPAVVPLAELIDLIYGHLADGGPDAPGEAIHTVISQSRDVQRALGIWISGTWQHPRALQLRLIDGHARAAA